MDIDKVGIARRQLGTALGLFLRDQDPVSVQCLACGGAEVVEALAVHRGVTSFTNHILDQRQSLDLPRFRHLRGLYWNAFKHVFKPRSQELRDDEEIVQNFSDEKNDVALLIGWSDYATLTQRMPIATQVFQVWYFALNLEQLSPDVDQRPFYHYFPNLAQANRREQKRRLKRAVEKYEHDPELLKQSGTETEPLIIRTDPAG